MANETRQVQSQKLLSTGKENFQNTSERRYPGEAAGKYLAERLNHLPAASAYRSALFGGLLVLRQYEDAEAKGDTVTRDRLLRRNGFRNPKFWWDELYSTASEMTVKKRQIVVHGLHENGLVIEPSTIRGKDAFAVLSLGAKGKLNRVRKCSHCKLLFFARFNHQWFCRTKCQGDHYHSPEWRRQNRERNKRHQRKYRDKYFGKKRFEPLGNNRKSLREVPGGKAHS
jgi:hypothetical protein